MRSARLRWIWTLVVVVLVACNAAPDQTSSTEVAVAEIVDVTPEQYLAAHGRDVVVLDVRSPEEYAAGHIEGAINVPITDPTFAQRAGALDRRDTLLVHCAANAPGGRSARALAELQRQGFTKLENLVGGYAAYASASGKAAPASAPAH